MHNGQGIKSLFSENGIGWNSEGQTGATRRRADLDKLRIPADEREATDLDIRYIEGRRLLCAFLSLWGMDWGKGTMMGMEAVVTVTRLKRNAFALVLGVVFICASAALASVPPNFSGGSGSAESPYYISSSEDLSALAQRVMKRQSHRGRAYRFAHYIRPVHELCPKSV